MSVESCFDDYLTEKPPADPYAHYDAFVALLAKDVKLNIHTPIRCKDYGELLYDYVADGVTADWLKAFGIEKLDTEQLACRMYSAHLRAGDRWQNSQGQNSFSNKDIIFDDLLDSTDLCFLYRYPCNPNASKADINRCIDALKSRGRSI